MTLIAKVEPICRDAGLHMWYQECVDIFQIVPADKWIVDEDFDEMASKIMEREKVLPMLKNDDGKLNVWAAARFSIHEPHVGVICHLVGHGYIDHKGDGEHAYYRQSDKAKEAMRNTCVPESGAAGVI